MKKILACLLALSVFASCGGNSSNNSGNVNSGTKAKQSVIKASALISKVEAAALLEQGMDDKETTKRYFIDESRYVSKDFNFSIALWQEALHDKSSDFEKGLLKNGWATYMKEMEKAFARAPKTVAMDGIDGAAYLQDGGAMGLWLLHIFRGDYYIVITVSNTSISRVDSEEAILWKHEKLKEAGKLAVRKLKDILG